jgi:hypothetical protein
MVPTRGLASAWYFDDDGRLLPPHSVVRILAEETTLKHQLRLQRRHRRANMLYRRPVADGLHRLPAPTAASPQAGADQIRYYLHSDLNVKIAGAHGGISVGPDGATHQSLEEISIMGVLPNMTSGPPLRPDDRLRGSHPRCRRPGIHPLCPRGDPGA